MPETSTLTSRLSPLVIQVLLTLKKISFCCCSREKSVLKMSSLTFSLPFYGTFNAAKLFMYKGDRIIARPKGYSISA